MPGRPMAQENVWMTATLPDASAIAAEVRQLARHAHRLLNDPATESRQLEDLARQITRLRRHVGSRRGTPVARWLDHLERMVPALSVQS